jgi:predicted outer membrane repeat protein
MSLTFKPSVLSKQSTGKARIRVTAKYLVLMLALLATMIIPTPTFAATTLNVNSCTETALRQAVNNAANGDTVKFGCSGTITLTGGPTGYIEINKNLTLDGSGQKVTIDGAKTTALFFVYGYRTVNFSNLTLANGYTNTDGGAIFAQQYSTVNISNVTFSGNVASLYGGAVFNQGATVTIKGSTFSSSSVSEDGGAVFNSYNGQLQVSNTTFSANSAKHGGAIYSDQGTVNVNSTSFSNNSASAQAGAIQIWTGGTATINNSSFSGNRANSVGAVYNLNVMSIANSTFSSNTATNGNGGAVGNKPYGSGLGKMDIVNSTFAGNSAQVSGGGITNEGSLTIVNSTFSGNTALWAGSPAGGGIRNFSWGTVKLINTIMANYGTGGNCMGQFLNGGYNLESGSSCGFGSANYSKSNTDPKLDPTGLKNNGGPTQTIALQPDSPARNAGSASVCKSAPVNGKDQREMQRRADGCDIGAYDSAGTTTVLQISAKMILAGTPVTMKVAVIKTLPATITGKVVFKDGSKILATVIPDSSGLASFTTSWLVDAGTHNLVAEFLGDANYAPSVSNIVPLVVIPSAYV